MERHFTPRDELSAILVEERVATESRVRPPIAADPADGLRPVIEFFNPSAGKPPAELRIPKRIDFLAYGT